MTLTDFKYCFSGSLTMTEFLLFSIIILQDSGMVNRYVGDMLNQILKKLQQQLMNYNGPTPTDIYLSPPKHLQLTTAQYKFY